MFSFCGFQNIQFKKLIILNLNYFNIILRSSLKCLILTIIWEKMALYWGDSPQYGSGDHHMG